jgi:phosphate transport system protein
MAADLRMVVTAIQVANDLERTGDMAKQLCKRAVQIESLSLAPKFYNGVKHMTDLVARQLKAALDAYAARDRRAAIEVCAATTRWTPSTPRCSANCSPT